MNELPPEARLHRIQARCVAGPWFDKECVRVMDIRETTTMSLVHDAIQEMVNFDAEHPFYFFWADGWNEARFYIPEMLQLDPLKENIDLDLYEELPLWKYLSAGHGKQKFYYAYLSDGGDWFFELSILPFEGVAFPDEFYPLPVESLSEGPDPIQYGSGFDDYAEADDDLATPEMRKAAAEENPLWNEEDVGDPSSFLFPEDEDDEEV